MKRFLIVTLLALSIFGLTLGLTASLAVDADDVATGSTTVSGCDDSVDVAFGLATGDISAIAEIALTDVAAACDGQTVNVEVTDGDGPVLVQGTADVSGGLVLDLTGVRTVSAATVTGVVVTITG